MDELLAFIPLFEQGAFERAESVYLSTGEYLPEMERLSEIVAASDIALPEFDWLPWAETARTYLQNPDSISDADLETVRMLFTVVRDADRFNRELLPFMCAKGVVHHLLVRLRSLSA